MLRAVYQRCRELLMGLGEWVTLLKVLAPGLVNWLAIKVLPAAAVRHARLAKIDV